jgi:hypothetical protein
MAPSRRSHGHHSCHAFGTKPAHDSATVATGSRDVPLGLPSTMSLSTTDARCLKPLHTFGVEGHQSTPLAPKVSTIRDRRKGEVVPAKQHSHNSSSISVIVKSPLHTSPNKPKSHVDRSQPPGRTWHDASEDHFPQHTSFSMALSVGGVGVCYLFLDHNWIHASTELWMVIISLVNVFTERFS